ncbi:odorant receptor 67d [Culex quinquefasciatus]|uniref:odorant receptor 67d n=1 Tax=Culex quinquefasciatus TaxID=7176 RepID=UPI0018E39BC1|nr:odorant receptor 67d [Culex quinquefasciatus]
MIVSILVYIYCCVFTAYEVRCSVKELIFCLVTSGLAPHKTVHVWTFLMFRKELYWFHQYTKDLYREECKDRTKSMLMKNVSLLSVTTKLMLVAYTCISSAMDIVPIISSAASGEKTLPFGFYIPFLDHTSSPGFTCNFIIHVTLTVYVLCSGYGADCIYLIAMASSFTQIDVLMSALRELTTEIEAKKSDVGECLNQIIVRHQEHLKYLGTLESVFRIYFLVNFVSLALTLILSWYAAIVLSWYQGYGFILFISYGLFFGCFLGTLLAMKSEQLERAIYDVPWYKMSLANQKSMKFLLNSAQQPVSMTFIFYKLDVPTFLQMYKMIYSTFTMLLTVRDE